ncbi:MAG: hypothetical protein AABZ08_04885 [Planctomycetota bacterium]
MSTTAPSPKSNSDQDRLPDALSDLVNRVVRGTRLWPSERRDVRAELESHFREGLIELTGEGKSLSESVTYLRDDFGDPKLAAHLIRRGKKRGRPMIWKALVSVAAVCGATLCAGAGYVAYVAFGKPTPTVDYVAKINEPLQTLPITDRAWPHLREAMLQMLPALDLFSGSTIQSAKPGDAEWVKIAEGIATLRPFVPRLVEAATKPYWGYVYGMDGPEYLQQRGTVINKPPEPMSEIDPLIPPTLRMLLPHLSDVRGVGKFLAQNAKDLVRTGDFAGAWESLDTIHHLGMHQMSSRTLIEQLVGASLIKLANGEMQAMLHAMRDRLTPADLDMIHASHVMTGPLDSLRPQLKTEAFFFEDAVQYVFTDDGNGNGRLIPSQFSKIVGYTGPGQGTAEAGTDAGAIAIAAIHADRRETLAKYHEVLDRTVEFWSLPLYDLRRGEGNALILKLASDTTESKRFALIGALLPALSMADQIVRETRQSVLATRTLVGLLGYQADHQAMPARLADIAPKYLCELPTDLYSGMLFKYQLATDGTFTLYSVGHNLLDDNASREKIDDPMRHGSTTESDLVFWPPK